MKQHDVLNLLGVVQRVGYAMALVSAAIVVAGFLLTLVTTQVSTVALSVPLVVLVAAGLVLAWVCAASRALVRRMHFETAREDAA